jgi:hypothetical protein
MKETQRSFHLIDSSSITHAPRLFLLCPALVALNTLETKPYNSNPTSSPKLQQVLHVCTMLQQLLENCTEMQEAFATEATQRRRFNQRLWIANRPQTMQEIIRKRARYERQTERRQTIIVEKVSKKLQISSLVKLRQIPIGRQ